MNAAKLILALVSLALVATNAFRTILSRNVIRIPRVARSASTNSSRTQLYLDLFGLGPSEIVIVAVVAGVLYGPDRIRGQLRDNGVKNSVITSKWLRLEREERIDQMIEDAEMRRKLRAWDRVNASIESEDEQTMERLATWENE